MPPTPIGRGIRQQQQQLEHLPFELPPPPPPPPHTHTHTLHDYPCQLFTSDPKSKQDKVKNLAKILILQETLHVTHLLKLLDKMYKYKMVPTRTVGATERIRDAGRTDGRSETNIPPTTLLGKGYNNNNKHVFQKLEIVTLQTLGQSHCLQCNEIVDIIFFGLAFLRHEEHPCPEYGLYSHFQRRAWCSWHNVQWAGHLSGHSEAGSDACK